MPKKNPSSPERVTSFRRDLISLFSEERAWTAGQIGKLMKKVNLSTVYRNLTRLVAESVLQDAGIGGGETYYELSGRKHHAHMVCRICSGAFCIPCPVPGLKKKHQLNVFDRCHKCR